MGGSSQTETRGARRRFGPLDPYCMFAVGALILLAVVFAIGGMAVVAIVIAALGLLLMPADKYWNRDDPDR